MDTLKNLTDHQNPVTIDELNITATASVPQATLWKRELKKM